jgi:uncharacterized protein (TIGR00369 family)
MSAFDALYGLELLDVREEEARARVPVRDEVKQVAGLVHGGIYAAIAESLAIRATHPQVDGEAYATATQTSFLRPILEGSVHAAARRRHQGRTTWVWEVDLTDDEERLCALVRVTIAIRPPATPPAAP